MATNIYLSPKARLGKTKIEFILFRQPFKIEQDIGIWLGVDTSFNGFKEDMRLFVHEMHRILNQACYKWPTHVPRERYFDFSSIICNFQVLGKTRGLFLKKLVKNYHNYFMTKLLVRYGISLLLQNRVKQDQSICIEYNILLLNILKEMAIL